MRGRRGEPLSALFRSSCSRHSPEIGVRPLWPPSDGLAPPRSPSLLLPSVGPSSFSAARGLVLSSARLPPTIRATFSRSFPHRGPPPGSGLLLRYAVRAVASPSARSPLTSTCTGTDRYTPGENTRSRTPERKRESWNSRGPSAGGSPLLESRDAAAGVSHASRRLRRSCEPHRLRSASK